MNASVALLIGGPDGLDAALREAAHERLRLSAKGTPITVVIIIPRRMEPGTLQQ